MTSTDTLTILPKFQTIQQTSEWSCGVTSAMMVLNYYGKLGDWNEASLAELRRDNTPSATTLRQAMDLSLIHILGRPAPLSSPHIWNNAIGTEIVTAIHHCAPSADIPVAVDGQPFHNLLTVSYTHLKTVNGEVAGTIYGNQEDYQIITEQRLGKKNLENKSTGTKKLQVTTDLGRIQITFDTNNA